MHVHAVWSAFGLTPVACPEQSLSTLQFRHSVFPFSVAFTYPSAHGSHVAPSWRYCSAHTLHVAPDHFPAHSHTHDDCVASAYAVCVPAAHTDAHAVHVA